MSRMSEWLSEAQEELGIDIEVDYGELLDLTRVVAHNVARPAAPLTAFLVGYAAAQAGGGAAEISAASSRLSALAEQRGADAPADEPDAPSQP